MAAAGLRFSKVHERCRAKNISKNNAYLRLSELKCYWLLWLRLFFVSLVPDNQCVCGAGGVKVCCERERENDGEQDKQRMADRKRKKDRRKNNNCPYSSV